MKRISKKRLATTCIKVISENVDRIEEINFNISEVQDGDTNPTGKTSKWLLQTVSNLYTILGIKHNILVNLSNERS